MLAIQGTFSLKYTKLNNVERKTLVRARVNLEVSARNSVVGND